MKAGAIVKSKIRNPLTENLPPPAKQFSDLPEEITYLILSFLDLSSLTNARLVEKSLNNIAQDHSLWKQYHIAIRYALPDAEKDNFNLPLLLRTIKKLHATKIIVERRKITPERPYPFIQSPLACFPPKVFAAAITGNIEMMFSYIKTLPPNNLKTTHRIYSLYALAVAHGHFDVLDSLSLDDEEAKRVIFRYAFFVCASFGNNETLNVLWENMEDSLKSSTEMLALALINAVKEGHLHTAQRIFELSGIKLICICGIYDALNHSSGHVYNILQEALSRALIKQDPPMVQWLLRILQENNLVPLHGYENHPQMQKYYEKKYQKWKCSAIQVISAIIRSKNVESFKEYFDLIASHASPALFNAIAGITAREGTDSILKYMLIRFKAMVQQGKMHLHTYIAIIESIFVGSAKAQLINRMQLCNQLLLESKLISHAYLRIINMNAALKSIQWLESKGNFNAIFVSAFLTAAHGGNLEYLKWFVIQQRPLSADTPTLALYEALKTNQIDTLKWLKKQFNLAVNFEEAFSIVCKTLHPESIEWLYLQHEFGKNQWWDILQKACHAKNIPAIKLVAKYYPNLPPTRATTVLNACAASGNEKFITCIRENYCVPKEVIIDQFLGLSMYPSRLAFLQSLASLYPECITKEIKSQLLDKLNKLKGDAIEFYEPIHKWVENEVSLAEQAESSGYFCLYSATSSTTLKHKLPDTNAAQAKRRRFS